MIIVVLRLFYEKKGNWKGFHAHELLVGCPHLSNGVDELRREGSRNSSVNNPVLRGDEQSFAPQNMLF